MVDYTTYEVQSSDCYSCRCKECRHNDNCLNGCQWCISKGYTLEDWNEIKKCDKGVSG